MSNDTHGFEIELSALPDEAGDFREHPVKVGTPALRIRHPSGEWTTMPFTTPVQDAGLPMLGVYTIDGAEISCALTTVKGSTDNIPWQRPGVAYSANVRLDSLGDDVDGGTVYLWPLHKHADADKEG